MIMDDFVLKRCKPAADIGIYKCLDPRSESALPCSIRVARRVEARADGMEDLEIRPVCLQVLPASVDELCVAIRCVVTALRGLHAQGYVHRDVRWPNVLRDRDLWLLSDFELAARDGEHLPSNSVNPEYLPPEVNACRPYSTAGDMFCVGRLIRFWAAGRGGDIPKGAEDLAARLVDTDPDKRPSAAVLMAEEGSWIKG
jgi:serine/threonine protein kinase